MKIVRNTIPDGRMVAEILGGSPNTGSGKTSTSADDFLGGGSSVSTQRNQPVGDEFFGTGSEAPVNSAPKNAPSLDDLYSDL